MAKLKLDLSKVKHVKSDDKSTMLRHNDGHTITLVHSALSPENQAQLSALSKIPKDYSQSVDKNLADGGEVQKVRQVQKVRLSNRYDDNYHLYNEDRGTSVQGRHIRTANRVNSAAKSNIGDASTLHSIAKGEVSKAREIQKNKPRLSEGGEVDELSGSGSPSSPISRLDQGFGKVIAKAEGGPVSEQDEYGSPSRPVDRPDKGFGAIIVKAEGGKVDKPELKENTLDYNKLRKEKRNINNAENNKPIMNKKQAKYCMYCGGTVHEGECVGGEVKMAEGGDPADMTDQIVPDYKDPVAAENQPSDPLPQPQDHDKNAQLEAYKHNLTDIPRGFKSATPDNSAAAHMPGPNGEPPIAGYDVKAWQNAQNDIANAKEDNAAQIANAQQQAIQQNAIRTQLGQQPLPVPNVPNGPQIPGSEENPPANTDNPIDPSGQKAVTAVKAGADPQDPYSMLESGYNKQMAGIQGVSQAQQQQAQDNAKTLEIGQQAKATALAKYQEDYQDLEQERQHHMQDIRDGYIDPNRYWTGDKDGNGSHSKLAAGIGMILAGFNPTNKPNAALEFLKYNMDKNMQAQISNLGAKESMLSANLRQFGNMKDAATMTQIMQSDMVANELQQAAAKAATPMAKANALNAAGQLQQEMAPKFQEFAMRRAMINMANGNGDPNAIDHMLGYMRAVNPQMAKEMEGRYVPGVGLGKVEVPQAVREQLVAGQTLQNTAADVLNYSQKHTNLIPGSPEYNVGMQKAAILQQRIREGLLGTVFRESEKPLLNKLVDDNPAGFLKSVSTQPKLREILQSNSMQLNTLKQNYGLPTNNAPVQMEGQTIVNKSTGERMRMVNGKWAPVK